MGKHPKDSNRFLLLQYLIYQAMLEVYPPGIRTQQITYKLFKWRRIFKGIIPDYFQQFLGLFTQSRRCNLFSVFFCLGRKIYGPNHQPGFLLILPNGSFIPFLMDSRIPGMESR